MHLAKAIRGRQCGYCTYLKIFKCLTEWWSAIYLNWTVEDGTREGPWLSKLQYGNLEHFFLWTSTAASFPLSQTLGWKSWNLLRLYIKLYTAFLYVKVMLHQTIRNEDFWRNTVLQHCCDIVSNSYHIVPTLQRCIAVKIVVANRSL